jgi:hypothetical protein
MPVESKKLILKQLKQRAYLNKDFDGFRTDLLAYARIHFKDQNKDFSEASLGGLLLEMGAYVGDVLSFYLDHQFQELDPATAIEPINIENSLNAAGVPIVGASPSVVEGEFTIEVPAALDSSGRYVPNINSLPVILPETIVSADNGTLFELVNEIDFSEVDKNGNLLASLIAVDGNGDGTPESFLMSRSGDCISGFNVTETFTVDSFIQFREITLANSNVTEIKNVTDSFGNVYHRVEYLTQNVVFKPIPNTSDDYDVVEDILQIFPAPYRFIAKTGLQTNNTTLTFGGGNAETLDDDIIPDPSDFAIPLYGKTSIPRFSLDPSSLLRTSSLGIIPSSTSITVQYRYGGGLRHNAAQGSIRSINTLLMRFPNSPSNGIASLIRQSVSVINRAPASGGEDPLTIDELKSKIPAVKNSQSRIVSKPDLLARIYTMPSNFGRVFRAGIRSNPLNPLASQLFVVSRNINNQLSVSPDSLKKNLKTYLNQYRMISDAIDILDARVINIGVVFKITVDGQYNKHLVLQTVISRLQKYFSIKNFEIDQPIVLSDLTNIIFNNPGVTSVEDVKIKNITGNVGVRAYSDVQIDIKANTRRGFLGAPPGGIFELRYPDVDIIGNAT